MNNSVNDFVAGGGDLHKDELLKDATKSQQIVLAPNGEQGDDATFMIKTGSGFQLNMENMV
jgi:hypothetical protein